MHDMRNSVLFAHVGRSLGCLSHLSLTKSTLTDPFFIDYGDEEKENAFMCDLSVCCVLNVIYLDLMVIRLMVRCEVSFIYGLVNTK